MKRTALLIALLAATTVGGSSHAKSPGTPVHQPRFTANVQHARTWLREHTSDRAFRCAHRLWENESGWAVHARTGRAYGIPQSLPGHKMSSAGRDWQDSALTQVRWGTRYVRARYNSFCGALRFQGRNSWY